MARRALWIAAIAIQMVFGWSLLSGLGAPLLWYDEADTAMFGRRVLEYGYPKVHGEKNIVYGVEHELEVGVNEELDAYLGSPWGQYYFAAPAVAWSDRSEDLNERTRRVRLPFAIAGWLGVLLLGSVGATLWPAAAGGRALFWLGYGVCLLASVSLQLHLREARYYPLVVFALGLVAWLEAQHARGRLATGPRTLWVAGVMFCSFHLFYPAFGVITLAAGAAHGLHALRRFASWGERLRSAASGLAPYVLAGLAVLPMIAFYEIPSQSRAFFEVYRGAHYSWLANLENASRFLLRYEFAALALLGAGSLAGLRWNERRAGRERDAGLGTALGICDALLAFSLLWLLLVARAPLFFERYYSALSPVLAGLCALQWGCLIALAARGARRGAIAAGVVLGIALALHLQIRLPELRGRVHELRSPAYRGMLDHLIPYLAMAYPDPSKLVIATNYEAASFMFYLDATVILDIYAPDIERDRGLDADVIIPRPWSTNLEYLDEQAGRARFQRRDFRVANLVVNNLPELSLYNAVRLRHRFHDPPLDVGFGQAHILERVVGDGGPAALVRPPGRG